MVLNQLLLLLTLKTLVMDIIFLYHDPKFLDLGILMFITCLIFVSFKIVYCVTKVESYYMMVILVCLDLNMLLSIFFLFHYQFYF